MGNCWDFECAARAAGTKLQSAEDLINDSEPDIARMIIHQADFNLNEAKTLAQNPREEQELERLQERRQRAFKRLPWYHRAIFHATVSMRWLWDK